MIYEQDEQDEQDFFEQNAEPQNADKIPNNLITISLPVDEILNENDWVKLFELICHDKDHKDNKDEMAYLFRIFTLQCGCNIFTGTLVSEYLKYMHVADDIVLVCECEVCNVPVTTRKYKESISSYHEFIEWITEEMNPPIAEWDDNHEIIPPNALWADNQ